MIWLPIPLAVLATIPAFVLRFGGAHVTPGTEAFTYGVAILGAAFLLTWAAEVSEMDVPQGFALAGLALIAVMPEYAVDLYFAWQAAHHPAYTAYATANMTGANRLLVGIAWPLIVFLFCWKRGATRLDLPPSRSIELVFLSLATIYSFVIPLKGTISLVDMLFLGGCFVAYMWRVSRAEVGEPELVGPARFIGQFRPAGRRAIVIAIFLYSGTVILGAAEPFAEALIASGRAFGIDEFLLVQWLAPLASEAPEVVIACILTVKGDAQAGMGAVISAEVNQWTLLVGTLPLVYSLSLGHPGAVHLDARQAEEILLTGAQSAFAVAIIANLSLSLLEAGTLFGLFIITLALPNQEIRYMISAVYIALALGMLVRQRRALPALFRWGLSGHDHEAPA